jgi:23S rRNA pseudouridine2605 synthase
MKKRSPSSGRPSDRKSPSKPATAARSKRSSPGEKKEKPFAKFRDEIKKKNFVEREKAAKRKARLEKGKGTTADNPDESASPGFKAERPARPTLVRGEGDAPKSRSLRSSRSTDRRTERPNRRAPTPETRQAAREAKAKAKAEEPMRLNKYIAHCGICARRQAAEYVKQGLVSVNEMVEMNPGYLVQPTDEIKFKGQVVKPEERKVYILMNKPKDVITTADDEKGRTTVLDIVGKKVKERIFPVGRLDRMTTGLLLLTNDGDLAKKLSHPSHKVMKFYHVILDKPVAKQDLEKIRKGLELEDGPALVDGIDYLNGKKDEVGVELHVGKNRIVRRIFEQLGYGVVRLDRTYYAGLTKKDLGRGHFRHLTEQEIIMLKHFK